MSVAEGSELSGRALGLQLAPQQLADALGVRVQYFDFPPEVWASWTCSTSTLTLARSCRGQRREYALAIAAGHKLHPQMVELHDAYLYGARFVPIYMNEIRHHVLGFASAYYQTWADKQAVARPARLG